VVCDNDATREDAKVNIWLTHSPRMHLHFTRPKLLQAQPLRVLPLVITRQAIRHDIFTSFTELAAVIDAYIGDWNDHPKPFT
jgi:hypothetical protein